MEEDVLAFMAVDHAGRVNPYEQIRRQILDAVAQGRLVPGTKLPPVRRLAQDLGVAANTVARAYRELEQAGVVSTRGRNGTVIEATANDVGRHVGDAASAFAHESLRWGVGEEEAVEYVRAAFRGR